MAFLIKRRDIWEEYSHCYSEPLLRQVLSRLVAECPLLRIFCRKTFPRGHPLMLGRGSFSGQSIGRQCRTPPCPAGPPKVGFNCQYPKWQLKEGPAVEDSCLLVGSLSGSTCCFWEDLKDTKPRPFCPRDLVVGVHLRGRAGSYFQTKVASGRLPARGHGKALQRPHILFELLAYFAQGHQGKTKDPVGRSKFRS